MSKGAIGSGHADLCRLSTRRNTNPRPSKPGNQGEWLHFKGVSDETSHPEKKNARGLIPCHSIAYNPQPWWIRLRNFTADANANDGIYHGKTNQRTYHMWPYAPYKLTKSPSRHFHASTFFGEHHPLIHQVPLHSWPWWSYLGSVVPQVSSTFNSQVGGYRGVPYWEISWVHMIQELFVVILTWYLRVAIHHVVSLSISTNLFRHLTRKAYILQHWYSPKVAFFLQYPFIFPHIFLVRLVLVCSRFWSGSSDQMGITSTSNGCCKIHLLDTPPKV